MEESGSLKTCTGEPNEPRKMIVQKAKTMEALTWALKDPDLHATDNKKEEESGFEDGNFALQRGWAQTTTEYTEESALSAEMKVLFSKEMRMSKAPNNASRSKALMPDQLINALKNRLDATKESVNSPLFIPVGECIVESIPQPKMESLLMKNVDHLTYLRGSWAP